MWIFLEGAALSIVADGIRAEHLLVQAHHVEDIRRVFGHDVPVIHRPMAALPYAASLPRAQVAGVVSACVGYIHYSRFPTACIHEAAGRG